MFAGLMSRWTTPTVCAAATAPAHGSAIRAASAAGSFPSAIRSSRERPGRSRMTRYSSPPVDSAEYSGTICGCSAAAHGVGVIHRDIKPANILLDANGNATVTDFGIALVTSRPARELLGSTAGTPHYISPEQSLGEPVD